MCKQCLQHGGSRETDDSGYRHPSQFITTYRRTQHSTLDIGPGISIANLAIIRPGPPKHFDDLGQSFVGRRLDSGKSCPSNRAMFLIFSYLQLLVPSESGLYASSES